MLTGLTDTIAFARQLTANSLQWTGENPSTANTLSAATIEQFTMSPKVGMSSTAYSRQFLTQSSFDVNAFIMNDLTLVNAIGVDSAAVNGSGTAQPTGLRSITGVTVQTIGSNGAAADWASCVLAETNVANSNADIGTMAWLTNPKVRGKWKTTLKSTTAGSLYLWTDEQQVNGYRAEVTTSIPSNLTVGTSTTVCSIAVFGVWSELLIGEWGGAMDVVVDPYTYVQQNMVQIVTALMVDINVRHPAAFNIQIGILTS
jgi:HK97 family phage major capsid protein